MYHHRSLKLARVEASTVTKMNKERGHDEAVAVAVAVASVAISVLAAAASSSTVGAGGAMGVACATTYGSSWLVLSGNFKGSAG